MSFWQEVAEAAAAAQFPSLRGLRFRPGGRLPLLDLPARNGYPSGFRQLQLPKQETRSARDELEGQVLTDRFELGLSFYALKSRHGAACKGILLKNRALPHNVLPWAALPASRELLKRALESLGLLNQLSERRCNGMARFYRPGQALPRHVDHEMFEDTIVGVVLRASSTDGLRLCQETPSPDGSMALLAEAKGIGGFKAAFFAELGFQLREEDGLCFCLQGAARELAHEVPTVSSERLSLTFRWFRDDFLQELEDLEASLEQG